MLRWNRLSNLIRRVSSHTESTVCKRYIATILRE
jgi:hypothetical protein